MTALQIFLIVCSAIAILAGLFILVQAFLTKRALSQKEQQPPAPVVNHKPDLTIKINLPSNRMMVDDLASEQLKKDLDLVSQDEVLETDLTFNDPIANHAVVNEDITKTNVTKNVDVDDTVYLVMDDTDIDIDDNTDTFSILANATETIKPVVHTYDESKLKIQSSEATSQRLDNHIQSQIDQEQNNPLNNAERNITITLIPTEPYATIAGTDVLALADRYGMKYGAMKMFHRYENKDGTGMLWFSMMMLSEHGVESFDLNRLPTQSVLGLALFLPLPHPKALQGFESMISLSKLMAVDLQATIYDEMGQVLTKETILEKEEFAKLYAQ